METGGFAAEAAEVLRGEFFEHSFGIIGLDLGMNLETEVNGCGS